MRVRLEVLELSNHSLSLLLGFLRLDPSIESFRFFFLPHHAQLLTTGSAVIGIEQNKAVGLCMHKSDIKRLHDLHVRTS